MKKRKNKSNNSTIKNRQDPSKSVNGQETLKNHNLKTSESSITGNMTKLNIESSTIISQNSIVDRRDCPKLISIDDESSICDMKVAKVALNSLPIAIPLQCIAKDHNETQKNQNPINDDNQNDQGNINISKNVQDCDPMENNGIPNIKNGSQTNQLSFQSSSIQEEKKFLESHGVLYKINSMSNGYGTLNELEKLNFCPSESKEPNKVIEIIDYAKNCKMNDEISLESLKNMNIDDKIENPENFQSKNLNKNDENEAHSNKDENLKSLKIRNTIRSVANNYKTIETILSSDKCLMLDEKLVKNIIDFIRSDINLLVKERKTILEELKGINLKKEITHDEKDKNIDYENTTIINRLMMRKLEIDFKIKEWTIEIRIMTLHNRLNYLAGQTNKKLMETLAFYHHFKESCDRYLKNIFDTI